MARGRAVLPRAGSRVPAGTACPSRPACRVTLSTSRPRSCVPCVCRGLAARPPLPFSFCRQLGEQNALLCQLQHRPMCPHVPYRAGNHPSGCLQAPSEGLAVPAALRCPQGRQFAATEKAEVWFWGCMEPGVPGGLGMCAPQRWQHGERQHRLRAGLLGELCAPSPCSSPPPAPHPHPREQVSLLCSLLRVGAAGPGAACAPGLDSSGMSQAVWVVAPCSLGTAPPGTLQPLPVPPQGPSHLSGHPQSCRHPPETPCGKQLVT